MELEIQRSTGKARLSNVRFFVHGPGKIGKSTFASGWPKNLFLSTERRLDHIAGIDYLYMEQWESWKEVISRLKKREYQQRYRTLVVDVIDLMFQDCFDYVKEKNNFEHPSDAGYGKGYDQIDTEFKFEFFRLMALPYAIIFISHTTQKDFVSEKGTVSKQMSVLPPRIKNIIFPHMGVIGYITYDVVDVIDPKTKMPDYRDVRVIKFEGTDSYEAGDGEGCLPKQLMLYKDPKKTFAKIHQYYQQKQ